MPAARYWRFKSLQIPGGGFLEISELQLFEGATQRTGTLTSSVSPTSGSVSDLGDNNLNTRCYWFEATAEDPSFWIKFDFGSGNAYNIDGFKQGGFDNSSRYIQSCVVEYSNDNTNWTSISNTISGLTYPGNYTLSSIIALEFNITPEVYVLDNTLLGNILSVLNVTPLAFFQAPSPLGSLDAIANIQPLVFVQIESPLGTLDALANQWAAIASAPSMLGDAQALSWHLFARVDVPSMLGAANPLAVHDFTGQLGDATTYYVMDLIGPSGTVRAPISSWQATLQTGLSNYVQCVVPAVSAYVDTINAATQFVVSRRVVLPGDVVIEYEMARAPVQTVSLDQGPSRYTATISGYSSGFAPDEDPSAVYNRTLQDIRSISVATGGTRVRCSIDWLLRPSHRVYAGSRNFVASYINYYVGNNDAYMEVGERT